MTSLPFLLIVGLIFYFYTQSPIPADSGEEKPFNSSRDGNSLFWFKIICFLPIVSSYQVASFYPGVTLPSHMLFQLALLTRMKAGFRQGWIRGPWAGVWVGRARLKGPPLHLGVSPRCCPCIDPVLRDPGISTGLPRTPSSSRTLCTPHTPPVPLGLHFRGCALHPPALGCTATS